MRFQPLAIPGAYSISIEPNVDERGHFARVWCQEEFAAHGITDTMVQASVSFNQAAGTLRGMHFTWPPSREGKLVSCDRGRVYDVLLDLRPDSPTFLEHRAIELDAVEQNAVYIPQGVAHGFQTLAPDCEVRYMMTESYRPQHAAAVRYDDPAFGICWRLPVSVVSERDRRLADFDRAEHCRRFFGNARA